MCHKHIRVFVTTTPFMVIVITIVVCAVRVIFRLTRWIFFCCLDYPLFFISFFASSSLRCLVFGLLFSLIYFALFGLFVLCDFICWCSFTNSFSLSLTHTHFVRKRVQWIRSNDSYSPSNLYLQCVPMYNMYVRNAAPNSHNFYMAIIQETGNCKHIN